MISGTTFTPTVSLQFSQSANSFVSWSTVNDSNSSDTIELTGTSLVIQSTSNKVLPTTNTTTQEADQNEDDSKKRQVAVICGACAGVVIIVVSLTAVLRNHFNSQVQDGN